MYTITLKKEQVFKKWSTDIYILTTSILVNNQYTFKLFGVIIFQYIDIFGNYRLRFRKLLENLKMTIELSNQNINNTL